MAASSPPNQTMMALTPAQIMALPADQQQQYLAGLSPQQRAIYAQELVNMGNADFMRNSIEKTAQCFVTGGSGQYSAWTAGSTLSFDLPTTQGFATGLLIQYNLTVTLAAGTGAGYQPTGNGIYSLFSRVELDYNGPQIVTHPVIMRELDESLGFTRGIKNAVLGGVNDSTIASHIVGTFPTLVGANTWRGYFWLPFNVLSRESPYGLLPINGVGNKPQLKLTCNSSLFGTDAFTNAVCANGGTGQAVSSVTGNINVDCVYLDGTNMESVTPKTLQNWQGMPTMQYYWESALSPFNANTLNKFTIATKLEHWFAFAYIIDGQQSNSYISGLSNLTAFGLSPDATAQQYFFNYGIGNNESIDNWHDRMVRRPLGQDFAEGIIPWVMAPVRGVVDADNRNGTQYLNMYASGFPATTHIYQVGAVGSVCTPRVELLLVSKNNAGLKIS